MLDLNWLQPFASWVTVARTSADWTIVVAMLYHDLNFYQFFHGNAFDQALLNQASSVLYKYLDSVFVILY